MREAPHIIKAINALKRFAGFSFENIKHIPYISEEMADQLVSLGYAEKRVSERDGITAEFMVTDAGWRALKAKAEPRRKLATLEPRLKALPSRLKPPK